MARKDLAKLVEWLNSDKDAYFDKVMRDLRSIGPAAVKAHDRTTAGVLVEELVRAFWYWDKRVPVAKSHKERGDEEAEAFVAEREKARGRRDAIIGLLLALREVTDHMRSSRHSEKKGKDFARHLGEKIDECEMQWRIIADKRIAQGEQGGRWVLHIRE